MKNIPLADATPEIVSSATVALGITRTKKLGWEQKISLGEGLKKTNLYINTYKPKGCIDENLLMERLTI
jgi:hypothetical protein